MPPRADHGAALVVLNVAEKPSVAKEISSLCSNGTPAKFPSTSKFNPNYQFAYTLRGRNCQMLFTSVRGHLKELDFPAHYRSWADIDPVDLFDAPICRRVKAENEDISKNLQALAKRAHWLVLWLDCDREGEGIAFEVMEVCQEVNPRLDIYRAIFSAVTR
eukprot:GHVT01029372.1.p2 GENE.GHVT01029372.1~~GHVT01029372.1.p2  ORF type:complete len:161 (+),score=30.99 GHVT01029372.1:364-846(+)